MEEKKFTSISEAIIAATEHRGLTLTGMVRKCGLAKTLITRIKKGNGVTSTTIEAIGHALNVGFAKDENGWYFSPIDQ